MRKIVVLILFLCAFVTCYSAPTLKDRLLKASPGDFIVTAQGGSFSLLFIRSVDSKWLVIEEVAIDQNNVDLKKISWKKWIEKKAPGAASWTALIIDLEKNRLAQCFSYFQNQWLFIEKTDYYLDKLLTLQLFPTRDKERKRIGPSPLPGEIDRRRLWKPQLMLEGKKIDKADYEVLRTKWPNDKTRLANCIIELYLDASRPHFPFPYWLEIQSPHYTFKVNAVDSGKGIQSPMRELTPLNLPRLKAKDSCFNAPSIEGSSTGF